MGVANVPSAAGGGIKSVQRGSAGGPGNVTITAVDITKSFVTVFGTASSGTVAATGSVGAQSGTTGTSSITGNAVGLAGLGFTPARFAFNTYYQTMTFQSLSAGARNLNLNATNITGGTNNLVAAVVQGFLANSTTLTVSGACRFEVVEFA